jgi:hypothetical protein
METGKSPLSRIIYTFKATFFTLIVVGLVMGYFIATGNYSKGYRAGIVYKVSQKGFLFKTIEGEMNTGNYISTTTPSEDNTLNTKIWNFSVYKSDTLVQKKLEQCVASGNRAKLYYTERYFVFPWEGESKYFVYKVEEQK